MELCSKVSTERNQITALNSVIFEIHPFVFDHFYIFLFVFQAKQRYTHIPNGEITTSMHSSRMHTTRLLPISPSMHCSWGVSAMGVSASGGGVCSVGVYFPGGVCFMGMSASRGVSASGMGCAYPSILWTEFLTHVSENITLPQLCCGW